MIVYTLKHFHSDELLSASSNLRVISHEIARQSSSERGAENIFCVTMWKDGNVEKTRDFNNGKWGDWVK